MQKLNSKLSPAFKNGFTVPRLLKTRRAGGLTLALVVLAILPLLASQAQRVNGPSRITAITLQPASGSSDISIVGDSSLNQAQTWQDGEGYHVVVPNAVTAESLSAPRGIRIRRLGSSLEILLQVKPGAGVNVQTDGNRMQLHLDTKLQPRALESDRVVTPALENQLFEDRQPKTQSQSDQSPFKVSSTVEDLNSNATTLAPSAPPAHAAPSNNVNPALIVPNEPAPGTNSDAVDPSLAPEPQSEGWMASVFSGTSVLIVFSLGLFGLLVSRKLRSREAVAIATESFPEDEWNDAGISENVPAPYGSDADTSLVKRESSSNGLSRGPVTRMAVAGPTSLYGAYRIDQEVGKLIFGQTHRLDVLSSRASDDRRAIEASLIKGVNSADLDEAARRRAREALEEYGFVARQCAALLLAPDAFERTSAARLLGDIKSPAALPFLLESLYDSESIVRNQAVVSIGELKIPSAIGALLDIARTHPDVPSALLSRTLSACSVEGLDFFDAIPETGLLGSGGNIVEEITHLEAPAPCEELPEGSDDPALATALAQLESDDVQSRSEALKTLMQFPVQSAVGAITLVARDDHEAAVRSQALSSLAAINHESVFAAVLLGLSDETREVRAAAARSLNRLSFDRADAYVRVVESGDEETIRNVAKACLQAGIVSQNLDRLAASDHRQAYETFCLISLLAKAKITEPISEAIANHPDINVRLKAVHLLACTGEPDLLEQFRELATRDGMREDVKTALLEALYRMEHSNQPEPETIDAEIVSDEIVAETPAAELVDESKNPVEAEVQTNMDEFEF